ncbi:MULTISPECIES: radical SAM/SPASM domain-containing protein [unclassified Ruminococcus]|uniref:radical SAM/SPASM domain-containing protein n=1 Tax=unclassified Ruminococcus TaxID=2608920 RepID=UPI00210DB03F|nr:MULTISPECIES: radical SAM protein [unclassified Ruminococcus]MCQ4022513.1 radical SAM protein [Ruminococcus sp. zg-924]MCQ4115144.1 radical SAM protein [Ruminococcus sp. zg-921]
MKNNDFSLHSLFWEATLNCNAKCDFCGSRCGEYSETEPVQNEIDTKTICACLKEISEEMESRSIMINVTGGEPLLRKDLFEVMAYASQLGFPWGMVTNGSMIDSKTVEKMKKSGMKTISISLDGLPETHNALRKLPDGFQRIKQAVSILKKADFLDEVQITTVVNHKNIDELEGLFSELKLWNIDSWRLAIIDPIGRAEDNQDLLFTKEDYNKYFDFFERHMFNGQITFTTSCSHFLGIRDNLYRQHNFSCETGKHIASILANGDIYVCPNVPRIPELIQGNICKDSFTEIWKKGFLWFRKNDRQKSIHCQNCEYYGKCKGDSLHTWDFELNKPKFCYDKSFNFEHINKNCEERIKRTILSYYPKMKGLSISYGSSSERKIIFTPSASRELITFFSWGRYTPRNCCELLAGLAGFILEDKTIVVEFVIPGNLENRGATVAAFSERNYNELVQEINIINQNCPHNDSDYQMLGKNFHLVGIAHSHPGELSPTLSVPDMELHEAMQKRHPDFISLIVNPQKKRLCAFLDSAYRPIDVELLLSDEHELQLL